MRAYHCARAWFLLGCLTLLVPGASRADEWFLKIDGVPGMLIDGRFSGWTPVYSAGALLNRPMLNGAPGPASFSCEVRKAFDRISPALLQRWGDGESSRRVTLACVVTLPRPAIYRIILDNAFVASIAQEARSSPETVAKETICFHFDKIEAAWLDLDSNGGTTGGLTARFDQMANAGALISRPMFRVTVARQNGLLGVLVTWPAERGHTYYIGSSNGGVWKTTNWGATATTDGPLSVFVPTDAPNLLMRVEEVD